MKKMHGWQLSLCGCILGCSVLFAACENRGMDQKKQEQNQQRKNMNQKQGMEKQSSYRYQNQKG